MKIAGKAVGLGQPTYFIADIAANHDGDIGRAMKLIKLAAEAGADAVKFQHFRAEHIVSDRGFRELGKLDHQSRWKQSVYEVYKNASLDWSWTKELHSAALENNIHFFTSPYDFGSVDHVDEFVPVYKIGSGDITWLELIRHIASKGKPIIAATGASTLDDVRRLVKVLNEAEVPYSIMQCNTNYTGSEDNFRFINLRVLETYRQIFPEAILGLSDHTPGNVTVLGAVSLGARIIEKHFTDDTKRDGPDHHFSMTPESWNEMVAATRNLEAALGNGEKTIEDNESQTSLIQRRGLRFASNLKIGHLITRDDLVVLRPMTENGLAAHEIDAVIGKELVMNVTEHQQVTRECIKNYMN